MRGAESCCADEALAPGQHALRPLPDAAQAASTTCGLVAAAQLKQCCVRPAAMALPQTALATGGPRSAPAISCRCPFRNDLHRCSAVHAWAVIWCSLAHQRWAWCRYAACGPCALMAVSLRGARHDEMRDACSARGGAAVHAQWLVQGHTCGWQQRLRAAAKCRSMQEPSWLPGSRLCRSLLAARHCGFRVLLLARLATTLYLARMAQMHRGPAPRLCLAFTCHKAL